jgi:hypothetical protein
MDRIRRTEKAECPHCYSKNVVPVGGDAKERREPESVLTRCQESICGRVYLFVKKPP